jgi:hypothetical protein
MEVSEMVKWEIYHNLANLMKIDILEEEMKDIDDLIDAPPKGTRELRNAFSNYISRFGSGFPIQPKTIGTKKAGRTKNTVFRMQVRFISEYYGIHWGECKEDDYCKKLISYYLLHHLASYFQ